MWLNAGSDFGASFSWDIFGSGEMLGLWRAEVFLLSFHVGFVPLGFALTAAGQVRRSWQPVLALQVAGPLYGRSRSNPFYLINKCLYAGWILPNALRVH